ncbi:MAG: hypothetical protein LRY71_03815 [Bacillaceae bacterium]|nr:hypothetical protein [Bacillaceae bacterium]
MKKFKVTLYGVLISLLLSLAYSFYVYVTTPDWGDLVSLATFIVLFSILCFITLIVQIVFLFKKKL